MSLPYTNPAAMDAANPYFQDNQFVIGQQARNNNTAIWGNFDYLNAGTNIYDSANKSTLDDSDRMGLLDSAASWALKYFTYANLKTSLTTYFDTLYLPIARVFGLRVAWVNFSATGGTITVRNSSGITSVVRNNAGDYTVTMSSARNNIYYNVHVNCSPNYGVQYGTFVNLNTVAATTSEQAPTTTVFRFTISYDAVTAFDPKYVSVSIFENA